MKVVDQGLDQRPEVELPPLDLDSDLRLEIAVLLEDLADQAFDVLHVAAQGLQHLARFGARNLLPQRELQDPPRQGDGVEGSPQVVGHEGEILFPPLLHLQRTLGGIGLQREADGLVEHPVDDVERLPLQVQPGAVGDVVDTAAQDVVLRHDLFDVEGVLDAL
jgi:hypothetical protein